MRHDNSLPMHSVPAIQKRGRRAVPWCFHPSRGPEDDRVRNLRIQAVPARDRPPTGMHQLEFTRPTRLSVLMRQENTGSCGHCGASLARQRVDARYCGKRCRIIATKKRARIRKGAFMAGTSRTCLECRSTFLATFDRHVYCGDVCQRAAYQKRIGGTKNRNCEVCSKEFTPNSSMHWLCSKECIRVRHRHQRLAGRYGLSAESFEDLLRRQGGGCAICQTTESNRWAVDHDHACCDGEVTCGKCVRGILCFPCNQALGLLKDSAENLSRALAYITGSNEPGQPGSIYR